MMVIVPRIKMRSVLFDDDVDTGAGGDGSLHFYPPLPSITFTTRLDHLATFVRSEPSPKLGLLSTPPQSSQVSEEQPIRKIHFSVQQMQ